MRQVTRSKLSSSNGSASALAWATRRLASARLPICSRTSESISSVMSVAQARAPRGAEGEGGGRGAGGATGARRGGGEGGGRGAGPGRHIEHVPVALGLRQLDQAVEALALGVRLAREMSRLGEGRVGEE